MGISIGLILRGNSFRRFQEKHAHSSDPGFLGDHLLCAVDLVWNVNFKTTKTITWPPGSGGGHHPSENASSPKEYFSAERPGSPIPARGATPAKGA